jgi:hypothetical protein
MKTISLGVLASFLVLSGLAMAQSGEKKPDSSMMEHMMKGKDKESNERMMKMMDQCSAMMESAETDAGAAKESQKQ